MYRTLRAILVRSAVGFLLAVVMQAGVSAPADQAIENGWFFAQTGGGLGKGYAVTNDGDIPYWTFFQEAGGVQVLGYPISRRWTNGPFTYQAFQKAILQWQPGKGMFYANTYDQLSDQGKDAWLDAFRLTPEPQAFPEDAGQPFEVAKQNHLRLLEQNAAIKAKWYTNNNWLNAYGLPVAYEDRGDVRVLRAQRAVFQQWMIATAWASPGEVVISNGGDVYKEAGLIGTSATSPHLATEDPASRGRIVYSEWDLDSYRLFVMDSDGGNVRPITHCAECDPGFLSGDTHPVWSPDGTKIAFYRSLKTTLVGKVVHDSHIYVVNADGSNVRWVTHAVRGGLWEGRPSWSPDGSQIAFFNDGLFLIEPDGRNRRELAVHNCPFVTFHLDRPAWSPDGTQIGLNCELGAGFSVVSSNGGTARVLSPLGFAPAWSPDGTQIAVRQIVGGGNFIISVMDVDGQNARDLTEGGDSGWAGDPVWSPDGTQIGFSNHRLGETTLDIMDADGSNRYTLAYGDFMGFDWSAAAGTTSAIATATSTTSTPPPQPTPTPSPAGAQTEDTSSEPSSSAVFEIAALDCLGKPESVTIRNFGGASGSLEGWVIHDDGSKHSYIFGSDALLSAGSDITLWSWTGASTKRIFWTGRAVWNNTGDTAYLLNPSGTVIDQLRCS